MSYRRSYNSSQCRREFAKKRGKIISERQITDLIDIDKRFIEQQNPFQFIQLNKFYFD